MEPADLWNRDDATTRRQLYLPWLRAVVLESLVWARGVVVGEVRQQGSAEMPFIQDDHMVQALSSDRPDDPLHEGILQSDQLQLIP